MRTPSAFRSASVADTASTSSISMRSVISSSSQSPARPSSRSTWATLAPKPASRNCSDRHVDRHRQRTPGALPAPRRARGLAQHPVADRHDQALLLGQRDEVVGLDQAARRVAASGSAPRQPTSWPSPRAHLRLVVQHELAARDGLRQLRLELQRCERALRRARGRSSDAWRGPGAWPGTSPRRRSGSGRPASSRAAGTARCPPRA